MDKSNKIALVTAAAVWFLTHLDRLAGWWERGAALLSGATKDDTEKAVQRVMDWWSSVPVIGSSFIDDFASGIFVLVVLFVVGAWIKNRFATQALSASQPSQAIEPTPQPHAALSGDQPHLEAIKRRLSELATECPVITSSRDKADRWRDKTAASIRELLSDDAADRFKRECNFSNNSEMAEVRRVLESGQEWLHAKAIAIRESDLRGSDARRESVTGADGSRPVAISPSLTPAAIISAIDAAPPLQRPDIKKYYIGLAVTWTCEFHDVTRIEDDDATIHLVWKPLEDCILVSADIDISKHKGLALLNKGASIEVTGEISRIDSMSVALGKATIRFGY